MYEYKVVEIVKVIDGDTIDAKLDLGFGITSRIRIRLAGVDTPEVYGKNAEEAGGLAKEFTEHWLNDRAGNLQIKTYKGSMMSTGVGDGSFGRWLGSFYDSVTGDSLSDALIKEGLVK